MTSNSVAVKLVAPDGHATLITLPSNTRDQKERATKEKSSTSTSFTELRTQGQNQRTECTRIRGTKTRLLEQEGQRTTAAPSPLINDIIPTVSEQQSQNYQKQP